MENLSSKNEGGTGEGGILVTQDRMIDSDSTKVNMKFKADASDTSNSSKISTPKVDLKKEIGKLFAVVVALSLRVSLR